MNTAVRASETPYAVKVEPGQDYWWCACGKSQNQPFCDESHLVDAVYSPVKYTSDVSTTVYFCGCKATESQPLCDGSHKKPV